MCGYVDVEIPRDLLASDFFFNIKNLLENWKSFTAGVDIRQRENILAIAMISRKP